LIEFIQVISTDYFEVMKTPLRAGRRFDSADRADTRGVVIVNRSFARKYWPNEDPLGRRIAAYNREFDVVGIVNDIREFGLLGELEPVVPLIYFSHSQYQRPDMQLVARTSGTSAAVIEGLRQEVFRLDPDQPVGAFVSLDQVLVESVWSRRTVAILMSGFGMLAFLLAVTGVYSVISYGVTQRSGEFGIRMALGAQRADVFASVLRDGLATVLAGIGMGLAGATIAARLIASKLYGVGPLDPSTFIGMALVMVAVAILACSIPARRAAKVDPMVALRCE